MPVGTRSRKRLDEGTGDKSKKKSDVPTQEQRRKRGQKATDADVGGSASVEDSTAAPSSLPEELVSCDRTQASGAVAETQSNTTDSTAKEVKAREGNSGKKGKIVVDKVANVRTEERRGKDDSEMESAEILEKNMGEVFLKVMEAYKKETIVRNQIKGKPKSGRTWKTEQTARFSDLRKDRPLKSSWERKMAQKAEKLSVRKFQQELKDAKREAIELKKQRRAEHQKRKEENQKKSEIVQVIKNSAKLKRMRKKQLRYIEKR